jgi:PadR family transcriptional regulator, regulatory protein PadR
MAAGYDPQLLKGVLSLLLLHVLAERESYGYEVVQRLHGLGLTDLAAGTVYPALSRLEREQWLASRLVPSEEGPARKYYRLTLAGHAALESGTAQWHSLAELVSRQLSRPVPHPTKET